MRIEDPAKVAETKVNIIGNRCHSILSRLSKSESLTEEERNVIFKELEKIYVVAVSMNNEHHGNKQHA